MRLIDADELWQKIFTHDFSPMKIDENTNKVGFEIKRIIDNAPTINPYFPISEEVFHEITDAEWEHSDSFWVTTPRGKKVEFEKKRPQGKWLFLKANKEQTDGYECSVCKTTYHTRVPYFSEFNFCPNCGASMKKGGVE